jgi:hypothetical protein
MLHPNRMKQEKDLVLLQNASAFFDLSRVEDFPAEIFSTPAF